MAVAAIVIGLAGSRLTRDADDLADVTGLGEAMMGAVFIGATTSLPGIVTSIVAGAAGHADFAVSHALGGIALQTAFLGVADALYRRANLEHAAASEGIMLQAAMLLALLCLVLVATGSPAVTVLGVHPATPITALAYLGGLRLLRDARDRPMWHPRRTAETRPDETKAAGMAGRGAGRLWLRFAGLALVVGAAGFLVSRAGVAIAERTGLSETVVGGLAATFVTSLPELVTAIAAVRRGALTLAVAGIVGGNTFDVLLVGLVDVSYREASVYHAMTDRHVLLIALAGLMTSVLLLGLVRRQERGIANVGFESLLMLAIYAAGVLLLVAGG